MSDMMPHAVFALGVEDILPVIFVLIGIVSWIINALKEKSQVNERAARPVRPPQKKRDDSLQSEIDIFIQEVTDQRGDQRQRKPQQTRPAANRQRPATPQPRDRRPRQTQAPPAVPPPKPEKHVRPGDDISTRKGPGNRDLGGNLTRHIEERMKSHTVRDATEKRLGHDVDASVAAHLGISSSAKSSDTVVPQSSTIITQVQKMLSNPESAAQAILLNEILSPPRSKRS
ncbi:hypothetical protein CA54_51940 [Symmachiella macrocystis]|uniref:Uncharacterized protein n=1 Tax=Symmachiella macrocystis TaxID=2527985 RepID=A0A5C6B389_9PLAN|nr:hypothetical protein [Symmachiella macrocystis]TWU06795.1 hypothetical protein CA54_51940 [Symmachiella macrocystis]